MFYRDFVLVIFFGLLGWQPGVAQQNTQKPNVLFLAIDDLNDWVSCLRGHANVSTPNIDRLAARGVLFANAHCQAPLCGPSRASVMTGLRPSTSGIYGMIDDDSIRTNNSVTRDIKFLPEYFTEHGYHTMGIGKLFHQHVPKGIIDESGGRSKGFGPVPDQRFEWSGEGGAGFGRTSTDWGAFPEEDRSMPDFKSAEWAVERLKRDYEKPFFLGVGFLRPHVPWYVPPAWFEAINVDEVALPNFKLDDLLDVPEIAREINDLPMMPTTQWAVESGEYKKIVQAYLACIHFVDQQVGKVLDALENSRHYENTIVVLWSDHGYRLGEKGTFAKHCLWEEATKVPLIISSPGCHAGTVVYEPVELLSLYPTLLQLAGLPSYSRNEGQSLVPFITGSPLAVDRFAITTYGKDNHSVRSKHYRYIQYEDGSEELYDHRIDPNEWYNIANSPGVVTVKNEHRAQVPKQNAEWTIHSGYTFQPYFVNQRAESRARSK